MNLEKLLPMIPEYLKDLRLNLQNVVSQEGSFLSEKRLHLVSSAVLLNGNQKSLAADFPLSEAEHQSVSIAVSLMAMNNIYYRFNYSLENAELSVLKQLPAKLRMTQLAKPGVDKIDFELMCLAVSAVEGCALCMESHALALRSAGVTEQEIQGAVRVAAVWNSFLKSAF
jgi:lipoyl-dependent peroxiredoxin subunit D